MPYNIKIPGKNDLLEAFGKDFVEKSVKNDFRFTFYWKNVFFILFMKNSGVTDSSIHHDPVSIGLHLRKTSHKMLKLITFQHKLS
jgi:hypothetical protein